MLFFKTSANKFIKKTITLICLSEKFSYGFKKSICKKFIPEFKKGLHFKRSFYNYIYNGVTSDHIDRTVFLCGAYEKPILHAINDIYSGLDSKIFNCLDIGANVGNHSLFMSTIAHEVHAFEPYEIAYKRLDLNINDNNIKNIHVHKLGLGSENITLPLYAPEPGNIGTASLNKNFKKETEKLCDIEIRCADQYLISNNISDIKLIKIDVEGYEKNVLLGLKKTLIGARPVVVFEMSPLTLQSFNNKQDFIQTFPDGYSFFFFDMANKSSGAYNLRNYSFGHELRHQDIIAIPDEVCSYLKTINSPLVKNN